MKIRLGTVELARGIALRESPRRFSIVTSRDVQLLQAVRAAVARPLERGNARTRVRFAILRTHSDVEAASRFALTHPGDLAAATGCLVFIIEDGAASAELYLHDAVAAGVHCANMGLVTEVAYEFIGSELNARAER